MPVHNVHTSADGKCDSKDIKRVLKGGMQSSLPTVQARLQAERFSTVSSVVQQCPRLTASRSERTSRRTQIQCSAAFTSPLPCHYQRHRARTCPASIPHNLQQPRHALHYRQHPRQPVATQAIAGTLSATGIIPLGYDFLTFLTATVLVVPACKWLKISPVLGFLAAGVVLEQAG